MLGGGGELTWISVHPSDCIPARKREFEIIKWLMDNVLSDGNSTSHDDDVA